MTTCNMKATNKSFANVTNLKYALGDDTNRTK